jgi:D-tagatose-1,6-bisphosphate aldolase subunit GatZ/KbaZ
LVRDGFPILKVGPGLTFALREALYGLDLLASELVGGYGERPLSKTMERIMLASPAEWAAHYHGSDVNKRIQRHYSYSDRIRYYWGKPEASKAVAQLRHALDGVRIPETLMRQFLPNLDPGQAKDPGRILIEAVDSVLADYSAACLGKAI